MVAQGILRSHLARDLGPLGRWVVLGETRLVQTALGGLDRHGDQVLQLHDPARAGLEGLAVGPVHRAEADVLQHGAAVEHFEPLADLHRTPRWLMQRPPMPG